MDQALHSLKNNARKYDHTAKTRVIRPVLEDYIVLFEGYENVVEHGETTNTDKAKELLQTAFLLGTTDQLDVVYGRMRHGFSHVEGERNQKQRVVALLHNTIFQAFVHTFDMDALVALLGLIEDIYMVVQIDITAKNQEDNGDLTFVNTRGKDLKTFGLDDAQVVCFKDFKRKLTEMLNVFSVAYSTLDIFKEGSNVGDLTDDELCILLENGLLINTVSEHFQSLIAVTMTNAKKKSSAVGGGISEEAAGNHNQRSQTGAKDDKFNFWKSNDETAIEEKKADGHLLNIDFADNNPLDIDFTETLTKKQRMSNAFRKLIESGGIWTKAHVPLLGKVIMAQQDEFTNEKLYYDVHDMVMADKSVWSKPHMEMIKIVVLDPSLSHETMAALIDQQTKAVDLRLKASALSANHQRIYENGKSHGQGGRYLRFYRKEEDADFRTMLDRYFNPKHNARFVDLALKKQNAAMKSILEAQQGYDSLKWLQLITTS